MKNDVGGGGEGRGGGMSVSMCVCTRDGESDKESLLVGQNIPRFVLVGQECDTVFVFYSSRYCSFP